MGKVSKTAKASAVQMSKEKKVIPDQELIRLLRIDRASGIHPTTQGTDALLRAYDAALVAIEAHTDLNKELSLVNAPFADEVLVVKDGEAVPA